VRDPMDPEGMDASGGLGFGRQEPKQGAIAACA